MDQLTNYQTIIRKLLENYLGRHQGSSQPTTVENLLITDDEHGHYMVLKNGWDGKDRVQHIPIYIRLVQNQIWVEEDWTDFEVVDRLIQAGIPQTDIVLAFHHPGMRQIEDIVTS